MDRSDQLQQIFNASRLPLRLTVKAVDYYAQKDYTSLRFHSNDFRIRAIEIWDRPNPQDGWFRIYHGGQIAPELKQLVDGMAGFARKTSTLHYSDFFGDAAQIATAFGNLLADDGIQTIVQANPVFTRN